MKAPRAPRRRQVEVDEARRVANELRAELREVRAERDRYRRALLSLHRTALTFMESNHEVERGYGAGMAEVTRIVEPE